MKMKKHILRICTAALGTLTIAGSALDASAAATDPIWQSTTSRNEEGNISICFEEVEVQLPADWSGKCGMTITDDGVTFYQLASRNLWKQEGISGGGILFTLDCTWDSTDLDLPDYQIIGTGNEGTYYATFPTDLQAYSDDADALEEYMDMSYDMEWVKEHFFLLLTEEDSITDGIVTSDDGYILPQSSTTYLTYADVASFDDDTLQMAINEIYARHHRRFVIKEIQAYFDEKDWYTGTVDPDDFDVSVMSDCEQSNIALLLDCMQAQ